MAKPRHFHSRPGISKGPEDGADKAKGEGEGTGTGGEGGEGKGSAAVGLTPSPTEQPANDGMSIRPERESRQRIRRRRQSRIERRKRREEGTERTHGGPGQGHLCGGRTPPPPEENTDLPGFHPERAHLSLQGVYGNFLHHNDGSHLDRE